MNILMGNNTLALLAGSETWTETMAKAFHRLGHAVTVYSPHLGLIAAKLEAAGIRCINTLQTKSGVKPFTFVMEPSQSEGNYDVIICNHYDITKTLHAAFPKLPIIATVHGVLHTGPNGEVWPEHPVTEFQVNQYVGVSEEVADVLKRDYQLDPVVIRNPIDLERFKKSPLREKPKRFLINSNYTGVEEASTMLIKQVASHYGAELVAVGANFTETYETEAVIADCDVVFGMGRSLLEGMACGKVAVCHGRWGTGGVITKESYDVIKKQNFSGRNSKGQLATKEDLIAQIDRAYNQKNVDEVYELMQMNHADLSTAEEYLLIAKTLTQKA